jgi:hypothetical protein
VGVDTSESNFLIQEIGNTVLYDKAHSALDFVRWGTPNTGAPDYDPPHPDPPAGTIWIGADLPTGSDQSFGRDKFSTDTDSDTDWGLSGGINADTQTPGAVNDTGL